MALGRQTRTVIKLLVGVGLIVAILSFVDIREVLGLFRSVGPVTVGLLFLVYVADRLLMAYKWGLLLRAAGTPVRLTALVRAYFYGGFAATVLPAVGGDVVRYCALLDETVERTTLLASMVVEKLLGLLALAGLAVYAGATIAMALVETGSGLDTALTIVAGALAATVLGVAFVLLLRSPLWVRLGARLGGRWRENIEAVLEKIRFFAGRRAALLVFLALTCLEQLLPVLSLFILADALAVPISFSHLFSVFIVGIFLNRLPISIAGLGVQEGAFVSLFVLLGHSGEHGLALGLGARVLDFLLPLPVILPFLADAARSIRRARVRAAAPE